MNHYLFKHSALQKKQYLHTCASAAIAVRVPLKSTFSFRQKVVMSAARKGPTPSQAIDFLMLLQNLKLTKRTGWVRSGVQGAESIADHMYRMSLMALIAGDSGVNISHAVKVALVHDVTEAIVGDITPHCGVSKEEKFRLEQEAIVKIREMLGGDNPIAREVEALWHEYEDGATPEALLVKDFDKLEMVIQAAEYERDQKLPLDSFFESTRGRYTTETGKAWAEEIERRRAAMKE